MDDADLAAEIDERLRQAALAARRYATRQSTARLCMDCREPLTESRMAIGSGRCLECQEEHEYAARLYRRR